ncbi:hypothetical protein KC345_g266 [Hortaea werneckii]|nr:hypothetical protein KC345_g266 [Hortaea werneckii]
MLLPVHAGNLLHTAGGEVPDVEVPSSGRQEDPFILRVKCGGGELRAADVHTRQHGTGRMREAEGVEGGKRASAWARRADERFGVLKELGQWGGRGQLIVQVQVDVLV